MTDLLHRIKVFLYRQANPAPEYLLLKPFHGMEALWGPLQSELGFGEKLEPAIRHHVRADLGLVAPGQLIDLKAPSIWTLGDEDVIEWNYGYECTDRLDRDLISRNWSDYRWEDFTVAYPALGLEFDRQAILRLHSNLSAA
ncbi:MAG: hypothetical protein H6830_09095 [Planctomycetes bacterium]|nr:hypothetical protein [Planctomycetota bacterium]MCB9909878.1 hypothetical protein [Planctomycetota bacterium]MCB9913382.1 hypothetical protein [Planctomycetota bacterium]HPF14033.1 hypothetical protein [Planctomycetota bacterium]HRV80468.1 hypothetical protein [Planctomycetota bacterium]